MKFVLFILLILGFVSCGLLKNETMNNTKSDNNIQNSNYPNSTDIRFSTSLSEFVQTIDLGKLCNPVKLYIIFTVDTAGKMSDSDIIPGYFDQNVCKVDSIYIDELKVEFEKSMPIWKPTIKNDTITKIRYSIPVTFE